MDAPQKIQQSWIRDKGLRYNNSSSQRTSIFLQEFPEPQFPQDNTKRAKWLLHTQWVAWRREREKERWELREFDSFILHGKVCLLLVLKTDAAPLYQGRKNTCTLLWRENYILQGCWLGRHPWKIVWDKGIHGFSSQVMQKFEKCERPTTITSKNVHPSFLHHLDFWQHPHECTTPTVALINLIERSWTKSIQFVSRHLINFTHSTSRSRMSPTCSINLNPTSHTRPPPLGPRPNRLDKSHKPSRSILAKVKWLSQILTSPLNLGH